MFILLVTDTHVTEWELDVCDLLCHVPKEIVYYVNYRSISMVIIFLLSLLTYIILVGLG